MTETVAPVRALEFPPLLTGLAVPGGAYSAACAAAETADPGTVFYDIAPDTMDVAILLAPEVPLAKALGVSFAATLGFNDALGAVAPPEVGCHLVWPDRIRVNGAMCGSIKVRASTTDLTAEPDWLVLGLTVPVFRNTAAEPGETPDTTTLHEEGCGELTSADLVEAWGRHMMSWLHIYLTDGFEPLHEAWRTKGWSIGEKIDYPEPGTFVGLDEDGGMILKTESGTRLLPLARLIGAT